jgi:hypothetical protein
MSFTEPAAVTAPSAVLAAVRRLLRPMVGLLIRRGVTFPVLADLLRGLYVDVAANEMIADAKSRTDSRISLMTGVHRKEIRRLRDLEPQDGAEPAVVTVGTQLIARWIAMGAGTAPPLPRAADAGEASFESLVAAVTTDIRPRAVLDDWLAQGLIRVDEQDRVHLDVSAFLPRPGAREQLFFFGRNLHDHLAAGSANVLAPDQAPFLDRSAHYDRISHATARRIELAAREVVDRALREINATALRMIDEAEAAGVPPGADAGARINVGVFVYRDDGSAGPPGA